MHHWYTITAYDIVSSILGVFQIFKYLYSIKDFEKIVRFFKPLFNTICYFAIWKRVTLLWVLVVVSYNLLCISILIQFRNEILLKLLSTDLLFIFLLSCAVIVKLYVGTIVL